VTAGLRRIGETLLIVNASRYGGELYECIASNGVPPAVSRQIKVIVQCTYIDNAVPFHRRKIDSGVAYVRVELASGHRHHQMRIFNRCHYKVHESEVDVWIVGLLAKCLEMIAGKVCLQFVANLIAQGGR